MRTLPPIELDGHSVRVRVPDHDVLLWSQLLLSDCEGASHLDSLVDQLLDSPAVVTWCLVQSISERRTPYTGFDDLRCWFRDQGNDRLREDARQAWDEWQAEWRCAKFDLALSRRFAHAASASHRKRLLAEAMLADELGNDFLEARPWIRIGGVATIGWIWCEFGSLGASCGAASTAGDRHWFAGETFAAENGWEDRLWEAVAADCPRDIVAAVTEVATSTDWPLTEDGVSGSPSTAACTIELNRDVRRMRHRYLRQMEDHVDILPRLIERQVAESTTKQSFASDLETAKLAAMKELAYGASHEINNPLANISTRAQTLLRDESDPERRQKLAMINSQAFRAHEMISNMMLFAHPPDLRLETICVGHVIDEVVEEMQTAAERQAIALDWDRTAAGTAAELEISADPTHLAVMVQALIRNSFEALGQGGQTAVVVAFASEGAGSRSESSTNSTWPDIQIVVSDTGPGVPPEVREHIFDPFYSGREAGRGLGFGLSKAWRIADLHGGTIEVDDSMAVGASFIVTLPVHEPSNSVDASTPEES